MMKGTILVLFIRIYWRTRRQWILLLSSPLFIPFRIHNWKIEDAHRWTFTFFLSFSNVEEEEDFHLRSANEINVCLKLISIHYFKTGIVHIIINGKTGGNYKSTCHRFSFYFFGKRYARGRTWATTIFFPFLSSIFFFPIQNNNSDWIWPSGRRYFLSMNLLFFLIRFIGEKKNLFFTLFILGYKFRKCISLFLKK